jgi:hypothetical protein
MSGERKVGSTTAIWRRAPEPEKTRGVERRKIILVCTRAKVTWRVDRKRCAGCREDVEEHGECGGVEATFQPAAL